MRENDSAIEAPCKIPRRTAVNFMRTSVASCDTLRSDCLADIAQVGDTDVEQQQQELDSKEKFPGKEQCPVEINRKGLNKQSGYTFCLPG